MLWASATGREGAYGDRFPAKVRPGPLPFHDNERSGNKNISCARCQHHTFPDGPRALSAADGLSPSVGEGVIGPEHRNGRPGREKSDRQFYRRAKGQGGLAVGGSGAYADQRDAEAHQLNPASAAIHDEPSSMSLVDVLPPLSRAGAFIFRCARVTLC
jgi:hypothetical protein